MLEILAVLAIVGILAALAAPRLLFSIDTAESEVCKANRGTIALQVESYYLNEGSYPNWAALSTNTDYFPQGAPVCPDSHGEYSISTTGVVYCNVHNMDY